MNGEIVSQSLSIQLRESTVGEHRETEGTNFIKSLFQGTCSEKDYVAYLWSLKEIYEVLELALLKNKNHPAVSRLFFPELFRSSALTLDLEVWRAQYQTEISASLRSAVKTYIDRIKSVGESNPTLLVAHAYVRYLGDLAGGQMLGQSLRKRFPDRTGLNFYDYSIPDINQMKNLYRSRLDEVGVQFNSAVKEICTEAQAAFRYNQCLFDALAMKG